VTSTEATADVFWMAFRALPKKQRDAVLARMLEDREFREDIIDVTLIARRQKEPARRLDEYLADRKRR
jgi:hypothetical protein